MSSGLATFFRPDGTVVGYGVYFGTADILLGLAAGTPEGAWAAQKSGTHFPGCTCGEPAEPVVILSQYGSEWWWRGEWCPRCRCILGPCAPHACQVCHDSPYYSERHECVRAETYEGYPAFPVAAG